jgi:alpha-tubulin suppressor-like RCC1 family protein
MRALRHFAKVVATAILLCLTRGSYGQVNGNATISGTAFGQSLTLSTSSFVAGAVTSIKWGGKEYINNWDRGRQLQLNTQFFNRYECYNPYEAGSLYDALAQPTSSKLLSLTVAASGNVLESTTQMAWYLHQHESYDPLDSCGDPNSWLPFPNQPFPKPYTVPLSDYKIHKTITIGFAGLPNVIEYLSDHYVPEPVQKGLNNLTAVTPYEFSSVWSYDVVSKDYRTIRALSGEDDRIKVVATVDGNYAMGFYSPELLQPYDTVGSANFWRVVPPDPFYPDPHDPTKPDPDFACVHLGSINRYDSFNGPGFTHDRAYLVIGNLEQVRTTLGDVHVQFAALDPDVYNRHDYLAINGLQSAFATQDEAENHWLTQGLGQGLRASRTFSASQYLQLNPDVANAVGATNYVGAVGHYVSTGRAEGRGTVAKPAAGMQHLVALVNRTARAVGQNVYGQLGNGTTSPASGPTAVSLDLTVTEIAAGDYTSLAVKRDGTVWMWGSNQYGACGDGTTGGNFTTPVQVPIPARITTPSRPGKHAVAVGTGVYAAIDTQGQVWTWGINWNGRLGDGTADSRFTPARVKKSANPNDYLTGIVSIAAGGGTLAALDADTTVWSWGSGANGTLGNGSTNDSAYPVQVVQADAHGVSVPLLGMTQVACGSSGFCIALARSGPVFGWGNNDFSQMGIAPGGALSIAALIPVGPGSIDMIAAGSAHCIARSAVDGRVYAWGYNGYGQLGIGSAGTAQYPPVPMNSGPDGMSDIADLAAGGNFSAMVRYTDRAVFVTGDNQSNQLGVLGSPLTQSVPVKSSVVAAP